VTALGIMEFGSRKERIHMSMHMYDQDGNGQVSQQELAKAMRSMCRVAHVQQGVTCHVVM
jgi:hypothetical protein